LSNDARPVIRLQDGRQKRALSGHPWIYSNEIAMDAAAKAMAPGSVVAVHAHDGRPLGTATFNPHTLIAARLLDPDPAVPIDAAFFARKIERALALRARLYEAPFYRLIHAEADGMGGLVIDRYGDALAVQITTAGMDRLAEPLAAAIDAVLSPRVVTISREPAVAAEGIEAGTRLAKGALEGPLAVEEGPARGLADLAHGQKTGWFFDQRENRAFMARLARGARCLDAYCYTGAFALHLAAGGAEHVLGIDRSADALALAERAANDAGASCRFARAEVFGELERLAAAGERFDIVIADPPAFVKSRKDLPVGLKAYRKLARLAASLVTPGGFLLIASCSHNVEDTAFATEVARGLARAGRTGRLLRRAGAGPDHPVHPLLPETAYLKAQAFQLD
jgi:23S rRNA (cytosine1962-C5)-methyltransferase